jgi:hypothetical protein
VEKEAPGALSPDRTFVVQFAPPSRRGRVDSGRIEHLTSGAAAFYTSWRQLQRFVADAIAGAPTTPSPRRRRRGKAPTSPALPKEEP